MSKHPMPLITVDPYREEMGEHIKKHESITLSELLVSLYENGEWGDMICLLFDVTDLSESSITDERRHFAYLSGLNIDAELCNQKLAEIKEDLEKNRFDRGLSELQKAQMNDVGPKLMDRIDGFQLLNQQALIAAKAQIDATPSSPAPDSFWTGTGLSAFLDGIIGATTVTSVAFDGNNSSAEPQAPKYHISPEEKGDELAVLSAHDVLRDCDIPSSAVFLDDRDATNLQGSSSERSGRP